MAVLDMMKRAADRVSAGSATGAAPGIATLKTGGASSGGSAAAPPKAGTSKNTVAELMGVVAAFIPSEVIAIYITVLGFWGPEDGTAKWIIFAVAGALILPFILLGRAIQRKQRPGAVPVSFGRVAALTLIALVSFVAWAMALPGNPFLSLFDAATKVGSTVVVILAIGLPKVSQAFGLTS